MDDLKSRKAAIDAIERIIDRCEEIEAHLPEGDPDKTGYKMFPDYITVWEYLTQEQAEHPELDEWCTDCKEYDQEKHCCPRFNRVIRETVAEINPPKTGKWIPDNDSGRHETRFMCSACGETDRVPTIMGDPIWRYCPWCGEKKEVV